MADKIEMTKADLGKQLLTNAEPLDPEVSRELFAKYVRKLKENGTAVDSLLLVSHEIGYVQVFTGVKEATSLFASSWLQSYFEESSFSDKNGIMHEMKNITDIQEKEEEFMLPNLEIWVGGTYFMLTPFDWGIEKMVDLSREVID